MMPAAKNLAHSPRAVVPLEFCEFREMRDRASKTLTAQSCRLVRITLELQAY